MNKKDIKKDYVNFDVPKYKATIEIGKGTFFNIFNYPNAIHRFFMRVLLGWKITKL